jgi:hypothetical protein
VAVTGIVPIVLKTILHIPIPLTSMIVQTVDPSAAITTEPVGASPSIGLTVTVAVTVCPNKDRSGEVMRVVIVGILGVEFPSYS